MLNRETENIRSELFEHLVANSLYHEKEEGLSKEEIGKTLKELYGIDFSNRLLVKCLQKLSSSNAVIPFHGNKFILSEDKMKQISTHIEEYLALRASAVGEFLTRIKEAYPDLSEDESKTSSDCFFSTISSVFEKYGSLCTNIITGKASTRKGLAELPDFQSICIENLKKLKSPSLRKVAKNVFRNSLNHPTPELARLLYSLAQSYTIAQIMNVDPKLQALEAKRLSKRKLYLDTNILISLMTAQEAEIVRSIVAYSAGLGVKMVYTSETADEYLQLLHQSKSLFKRIPVHRESIIQKVEPLMKDPFIKTFWTESDGKKMQSWDGFLVKTEGFRELLSEKYGIVLEKPSVEINKNSSEFLQMRQACAQASLMKPVSALYHDAYHLLLVQRLRDKETVDELGFSSYFITRDHTLNIAENVVYKGAKAFGSVHISIWLQMISPFLSPKVNIEDASNIYAKLLGSHFPSLTKSVSPHDLVDLMGIWMDDPNINTAILRKIVGNRYMNQHLREIRQTSEEDPNNVSKTIGPILQTVVSQLEEENRSDLRKLKDEQAKEISELKAKIKPVETIQRRNPPSKFLIFTGCVLLATMIGCGFISSFLGINIPDLVYYILGGGGIAFISSFFFGVSVLKFLQKNP